MVLAEGKTIIGKVECLMKKFRSVLAASAALALLVSSAFAAPRPGDLTTGLINGGDWAAFGLRDAQALLNKPADSLLMRAVKMLPAEQVQSCVDKAGSFDMRVALKPDLDGVDKLALAMDMKTPLTAEDFAAAGSKFKAPEFTVAAPEGTAVTPLGAMDSDDSSIGLIYLAALERDGARYLIGANGDPANLAVMAGAPEGSALVTARTPANIWVQMQISAEALAKMDAALPLPLSLELGLDDTATSVKAMLWSNLVDEIGALIGKDLRAVLNGGAAAEAPLTSGSAPLAALLNLSASFLPENFKLADLIADADMIGEAESEINGAIGTVGLEWADLVKILRGNITLGAAGKLDAPMVGEVPGLYLHVSGIDAAKAGALAAMLAEQGKMVAGEPSAYDKDGWKGFTFAAPVSVLVASGEKGLLVAGMNADQFGQSAEAASGLAAALEPRNVALGFDVKALQPVLKKLFDSFGDSIPEEGRGIVSMVLDNMGMVDALSLVNADADTLVLEVTPNAEMVSAILPAAE